MEKTQSVKELILNIDAKTIFLPEFQREFVWEISKTYDLFDSLVKDIFIGSIIYGVPSFDIAVREIDTRKKNIKGKKQKSLEVKKITKSEIEKFNKTGGNFRLILDGQQRATALYRALKGVDEVWFISKDENEIKANSFEEASIEELLYEISGFQDDEKLSIKLSDVWEMEMKYLEDEILKKDYFHLTAYYKKYFKDTDFSESSEFKKYRILMKKINELLKSEKLLSYYLLDMSLEKFVIFFERSNTRGIQLNFIDILSAKLYTGNFNLKEKIKEFEIHNGDKINLMPEIIVRTIAYKKSNQKEIDRNYILSSLEAEDFKKWWDKVCQAYVVTINYLYENYFIISQDWMPYDNMLIPLINFLMEVGKDFSQITNKQSEFIEYWYWSSIFSNRYTSSTNERVIEDSNILQSVAKNKKVNSSIFFNKLSKSYILNSDDLYSYNKKSNAIYKGILNLINYENKGFLNWSNGGKLSLNSSIEDHHIYPKNYLFKILGNEPEFDFIDCVLNRTLIPKIQNIKISDQKPSDYLKVIKTINSNIEKSLNTHLIPKDLISGKYDEDFKYFLEYRAKEIFKIIKRIVIDLGIKIKNENNLSNVTDDRNNISIFSSYKDKKIVASFNPNNRTINYNNKIYGSPSSAAQQAKIDNGAPLNNTENGWTFWKYLDENNNIGKIADFRNIKNAV